MSYISEILLNTFRELFHLHFGKDIENIDSIKPGASNRSIYRITSGNDTCIGIFNENVKENIAFIEFSKLFLQNNLNVPEIYTVSDDKRFYLEEDLGDITLFEFSNDKKNEKSDVLKHYENSLIELLKFQLTLKDKIDYDALCYETAIFNAKQLSKDLEKFENYYIDKFGVITGENIKRHTYEEINRIVQRENRSFFMYRDFQPRNILIKDEKLYFIDYQSGRKGPLLYDVASFLYSGSININDKGREYLLDIYLDNLAMKISFNKNLKLDRFYYFALARIFQILGSYGYIYYKRRDNSVLKKMQKGLKNIAGISAKIEDEKISGFLKELSRQNKFLNLN